MDEYRAALAYQRRAFCSHTEVLRIEFPTILCESCFAAKVDGVFVQHREPDVLPESWESDLANVLDSDVAASIAQDCDSPRCESCRCNLHQAPLYIDTVELSERLGIPDETDTINPSRRLTTEILRLYERKCFACGRNDDLGIDHIEPRSNGGKAAFWNLQPLCRECGNAKGNRPPGNIVVVRDPWSD